jgi:hypothetical protein
MRRKGELLPAAIDSGWPHQIALPARFCENGGYKEIHGFCKDLTLCTRGHAVYDGEWFHVYCFAKREDAEKFKGRVGGVKFDPRNGKRDATGRVGIGPSLGREI